MICHIPLCLLARASEKQQRGWMRNPCSARPGGLRPSAGGIVREELLHAHPPGDTRRSGDIGVDHVAGDASSGTARSHRVPPPAPVLWVQEDSRAFGAAAGRCLWRGSPRTASGGHRAPWYGSLRCLPARSCKAQVQSTVPSALHTPPCAACMKGRVWGRAAALRSHCSKCPRAQDGRRSRQTIPGSAFIAL